MTDFKSDFTAFMSLLSQPSTQKLPAEAGAVLGVGEEADAGEKVSTLPNLSAVVKKRYISLVKKYHPDSAPENMRKLFNEYMMLLNKVYAQWKAEGKVSLNSGGVAGPSGDVCYGTKAGSYGDVCSKVYSGPSGDVCSKVYSDPSGGNSGFSDSSRGQTYSFIPHNGVFVNHEAKPRIFRNYYEYLLALGKDYYWQAHQILLKDWGMVNENPETTVYEALMFLEKAKLCYNKILSESPARKNPDYVFMIQNELTKLFDMNKNITRGLSANDEKSLCV